MDMTWVFIDTARLLLMLAVMVGIIPNRARMQRRHFLTLLAGGILVSGGVILDFADNFPAMNNVPLLGAEVPGHDLMISAGGYLLGFVFITLAVVGHVGALRTREQEQALDRLVSARELLAEIAKQLTADDVARAIVLGVRERAGIDRVGVYAVDEDTGAARGTWGIDSEGRLEDTSDVLIASPADRDPEADWWEVPEKYDEVGMNVVAPVRVDGRCLALICADNALSTRTVSEEQIQYLLLVAHEAASVIQRVGVLDELRRSRQRERLLRELVEAASDITNSHWAWEEEGADESHPDEARSERLSEVMRTIGEHLQVDHICSVLWREVRNGSPPRDVAPALGAAWRRDGREEEVHLWPRIAPWFSSSENQLSHLVIADVLEGDRWGDEAQHVAEVARAVLVAPIVHDATAVGVVCFGQADRPRHWSAAEVQFAHEIAARLGQAFARTVAEGRRWEAQRALRQRERYLSALAETAQPLLARTGDIPYDAVVSALGPAAGASRAYVFLNHRGPHGDVFTSQVAEWCAPGVEPQIDNPDLQDMHAGATGFQRWVDVLSRGEAIAGNVADLPPQESEFLATQDIKAILVLPIIVEGELAGFVGFDNCTDTRPWQPSEADLLRTAAASLSQAIERKRAEEALRESEQRFRSVFEGAKDAIFIETPDGVILDVNPAACELLGYTADEFVGMHVRDIVPPQIAASLDEVVAQHSQRGGIHTEAENLRKDGSLVSVDVTTNLVTIGGEQRVVAIVRDITERKRSEEALRFQQVVTETAFRHAPVGIVIMDADGVVSLWNDYMTDTYQVAPEDVEGRRFVDCFPALEEEGLAGELADVLEKGEAVFRPQWRHRTRHVGERVIDAAIYPLVAAAGEVLGAAMINDDITEELRRREQLAHGQRMQELGALAGGVAHDFNNILQAISGNLELARLAADTTAAPYLDNAVAAGKRAADLVRQLQAFSTREQPERTATDLELVVGETTRFLRETIDRRIAISVEAAPETWHAYVDPAKVHQVILNLCINARDAIVACLEGNCPRPDRRETDRFEIAVKLENRIVDREAAAAHVNARPGEYVLLSVSDNGCGMSEEVLSRAFEPFFSTKGPAGTGMGLATVYGVVKQHQGWIEVESQRGKGTTFRVCLPRDEGTQETKEAPAVSQRLPMGTGTILLVEDEAEVRAMTCDALQSLGYTVMEAENGAEALDLYTEHAEDIDLVLLDAVMPELSGLETLRRLRTLPTDVKVIVASGHVGAEEANEFMELGAISLLPKPYTLRELGMAIQEALAL